MNALPYFKPTIGRDYWVVEEALENAIVVRDRCLNSADWIEGYPHNPVGWPGLRTIPGLVPEEMDGLESLVRKATGSKRLWVEQPADGGHLSHNCIQVVGEEECGVRPHTDSRRLCRYAAVLYLNPSVPDECGTSFFRLRSPTGQLGGNTVTGPHDNLTEAMGTRYVPHDSFKEDVRISHRFNRLLIYRGNLIHSASSYWGHELAEKRMAAVFFWKA